MKKSVNVNAGLLILAACLLTATPLAAQSKTATLSLQKVFDGYWKTKQADAQLAERRSEFEKQLKDFLESYQKANANYKTVLDSASDMAVSVEERDKRKKAAEAKLLEIKEIETNITQLRRTAEVNLSEMGGRFRSKLFKDIQEVVATVAKSSGYAMVLDTVAQSVNNTPILVYASEENDLTDEVLRRINADAPANLPGAPAAPAAPVTNPPAATPPRLR